jgi:tetratricopeptide (TPR) repeat protein
MLGSAGTQIVLIVWPFLALLIFMVVGGQRAMLAAAVAGWLFLPPAQIDLPGLPDYGKTTAVIMGVLLGTIVFEPDRVLRFRPRWFDLPIIVFCVCPFFSAVSNDLGVYEGVGNTFIHFMNWLVPYWLGRIYLTDVESYRELGLGFIIGGMCLSPLCLIETKYSQIFQTLIYVTVDSEGQRYGGIRPRVFFTSGLECGLWMNAVALVAWWFWQTSQFKRLLGIPSIAICVGLVVVAILCRSGGATLLLATGFAALWISLLTKRKWAMWCLLCIAPVFFTLRTTSLWTGESGVELIRVVMGDSRADSLDYRFENDDLLIAKAVQQPFFGWGGWNRNRVYNELGEDISITDGYWIILFGVNGFVGLISLNLAMLLPAGMFLARFPVERWNQPSLGAIPVVAAVVDLFMIDCLVNGMPNVLYVIAAGGLFNIVPSRPRLPTSDHGNDDHARVAKAEETLAAQYQARGRTSKDQGRLVEAKTTWFHALDLYTKLAAAQPGRPALRQQWCDCANDLAWLLVNTADPAVNDPACALSLAMKTTESYPECSTYWNTLGASYYHTNDFKAASAAFDRSMTLSDGGTAFDYVFLTMAHAQLGNQDQAHHWFTKAMRSIEQHHTDHPELNRLCAEARSLLSTVPETSTTIH